MFLYNDNNFNVNEDGLNFNFALSSISDQEERSVIFPAKKQIIKKIFLISPKIIWEYLTKVI